MNSVKFSIKIKSINLKKINVFKFKNLTDGLDLYEEIVSPLYPFEYVVNPGDSFCDKNVFLLVVVNSNPGVFNFRSSLRETWTKRSIFPVNSPLKRILNECKTST